MSHISLLVLTSSGHHTEAEHLLEPFSEHLELEPYVTSCGCIGTQAYADAIEEADTIIDPTVRRREFYQLPHIIELQNKDKAAGGFGFPPALEDHWATFFLNPRMELIDRLVANHPLATVPDSDCPDCGGTGQFKTTYNKNAKWDWYHLGGRWINVFTDEIQGITAMEFSRLTYDVGGPLRTYAILTPDGQWLEKGELGWYTPDSELSPSEAWEACYKATLEKFADCKVHLYDCHT
jgi:hypothetical protein